MEQEILPIRDEAGCVGSTLTRSHERVLVAFICPRSNIVILIHYEVFLLDLTVSGAEELKELLLGRAVEVALPEDLLVGTRLHLAFVELLLHQVSFFLLLLLILRFDRELLRQLLVVLGSLVLVLEDVLLLEDTAHHLHANGSLLLVVVARTGVLLNLLWHTALSFSLGYAEARGGSFLLGDRELWIVHARANAGSVLLVLDQVDALLRLFINFDLFQLLQAFL